MAFYLADDSLTPLMALSAAYSIVLIFFAPFNFKPSNFKPFNFKPNNQKFICTNFLIRKIMDSAEISLKRSLAAL